MKYNCPTVRLTLVCALVGGSLLFAAAEASAQNKKRSETYFLTRADRAARVSCSVQTTPAKTRKCHDKQMASAHRILKYVKSGNKEKRLKRTLDCLQKVQVLPKKIRRKGMLWVERCAKR